MNPTGKKILYCATVDYHFKAFHIPEMKWFKSQGWEVHVAAAGDIHLPYTDKKFSISIHRSPFHLKNMKGYAQLRNIIDKYDYTLIHAHTPLGGVLGRLAAKKARKKGTKVIYTAHGFHFCKGAPPINWLMYYPIEKYLARCTDSLLTINEEDYKLATRHKFKAKSIQKVNGVGVDIDRFKPLEKNIKAEQKKSFGFQTDDFLLFNASEFNQNKNQRFLLYVLALLRQEFRNVKLLLAGEGSTLERCKELAERLEISDNVHFLGFRKDIEHILPLCDIAVSSSIREGLPVNIMEAMACGLPIVATSNRGHEELIHNGEQGYVVNKLKPGIFASHVNYLLKHEGVRVLYGQSGRNLIQEKYSVRKVMMEKSDMYQKLIASDTDASHVL